VSTRNEGVFEKYPLLNADTEALNSAATRQVRPKFGRAHLRHFWSAQSLPAKSAIISWGCNRFHVEGGKTAVIATDVGGKALQQYSVRVIDSVVVT